MSSDFFQRIKDFNNMYGLPVPSVPTLPGPKEFHERFQQFQKMLHKEFDEGDDVYVPHEELDTLVNMADWLGDMVVYCSSEACRFGIPLQYVLEIIMDSNASKLGIDGLPIIADGKIMKGPNYWKPEPRIKELLEALRHQGTREIKV